MTATPQEGPDPTLTAIWRERRRMEEMSDIIADLLNRVAVFGVLVVGREDFNDEMVSMATWQLVDSVQATRVKAIRAGYVETGVEGDDARLEDLLTRKNHAQNPVVTAGTPAGELARIQYEVGDILNGDHPAAVA